MTQYDPSADRPQPPPLASGGEPALLTGYRRVKRLQFWPLIGLISWLGLTPQPGEALAATNDLLLHFGGYLGAGLSCKLALPNARHWQVFTGLLGYSLAIEVGQYFIPNRAFDLRDLLANGAGIAVALGAYHLAVKPLDRRLERLLHPVK